MCLKNGRSPGDGRKKKPPTRMFTLGPRGVKRLFYPGVNRINIKINTVKSSRQST